MGKQELQQLQQENLELRNKLCGLERQTKLLRDGFESELKKHSGYYNKQLRDSAAKSQVVISELQSKLKRSQQLV